MTWRLAFRGLGWLCMATAVLVAMTLILWVWEWDPRIPGQRVGELHAVLTPWRSVLQELRVCLWCLAGMFWANLGRCCLRLSPPQMRVWLSQRRVVVGGLLIVEGLIVLARVLVNP